MNLNKPVAVLLASLIALGISQAKVFADNAFMKQGVQEYNAGDYVNAAGHLGAALSTDFNNATLHYYLANAYMHMKQRDGAIREFRIAYALQPDSEVGTFAKTALGSLGAAVTEAAQPAAVAAPSPFPAANVPVPQFDSHLGHTMSSLQQQAEQEKNFRTGVGQDTANNIGKSGQDVVQRTQTDMLNNMPRYYSHRSGNPYPVSLPPDATKQLDSMRQMYDAQRSRYLQSAQEQAQLIQMSSDNLQNLLNDKPKPGGSKLVPEGTNLYTRNYQPVGKTPSH